MNLARAFHGEVKAKVGHSHALLIPDKEPTWKGRQEAHKVPSSLAKLFPTNADLAAALGFGTHAKPKRHAGVTRDSFMGQARRWRGAKRNPDVAKKWAGPLRNAGRREQRKLATPGNERQALDFIARYGVTVTRLVCELDYGDESRDVKAHVYVGPEWFSADLDGPTFVELAGETRLRWGELADAFFTAYSGAYGAGDVFAGANIESVEALSFRLGKDPRVDYDYGISEAA